MSALRRHGIPEFLEIVNQVEELVGGLVHGITLGASLNRRPPQRESHG